METTPSPAAAPDLHLALRRFSDLLWSERHLLELLLFKLDQEQLVLSSGRARWLAHASREVAAVLDEIRDAELGRAVEADAAAIALGLEPGVSLAAIGEAAPSPWGALLGAHREAFAQLTAEIAEIADGNRELLAVSHRATQETIATLRDESSTYDGTGRPTPAAPAGHVVDRAL